MALPQEVAWEAEAGVVAAAVATPGTPSPLEGAGPDRHPTDRRNRSRLGRTEVAMVPTASNTPRTDSRGTPSSSSSSNSLGTLLPLSKLPPTEVPSRRRHPTSRRRPLVSSPVLTQPSSSTNSTNSSGTSTTKTSSSGTSTTSSRATRLGAATRSSRPQCPLASRELPRPPQKDGKGLNPARLSFRKVPPTPPRVRPPRDPSLPTWLVRC